MKSFAIHLLCVCSLILLKSVSAFAESEKFAVTCGSEGSARVEGYRAAVEDSSKGSVLEVTFHPSQNSFATRDIDYGWDYTYDALQSILNQNGNAISSDLKGVLTSIFKSPFYEPAFSTQTIDFDSKDCQLDNGGHTFRCHVDKYVQYVFPGNGGAPAPETIEDLSVHNEFLPMYRLKESTLKEPLPLITKDAVKDYPLEIRKSTLLTLEYKWRGDSYKFYISEPTEYGDQQPFQNCKFN